MPSKKSSKTKKSAKATSKKGTKKSSKAMNANKNGQPGEELKGADVRYSYIEGVTFGMKKVRYGAVNGEALFEGDIVLGSVGEMEAIKEQVENPQPDVELAVVVKSQFRWPNGVIPFRIDPSLPN